MSPDELYGSVAEENLEELTQEIPKGAIELQKVTVLTR